MTTPNNIVVFDSGRLRLMRMLMEGGYGVLDGNVTFHLFTNNITLPTDRVPSDFVEMTMSGYVPRVLSGAVDEGIDSNDADTWLWPPVAETAVGDPPLPVTAYGYFVTQNDDGTLLWGQRFDYPPVWVVNGDTYSFPAQLSLCGCCISAIPAPFLVFEIDACIAARPTNTFTVSGYILNQHAVTFTVDADLKIFPGDAFSVDAAVRAIPGAIVVEGPVFETWTAPAGLDSVSAFAIGAGGHGGPYDVGLNKQGCGGGGGGFVACWEMAVTRNQTYTLLAGVNGFAQGQSNVEGDNGQIVAWGGTDGFSGDQGYGGSWQGVGAVGFDGGDGGPSLDNFTSGGGASGWIEGPGSDGQSTYTSPGQGGDPANCGNDSAGSGGTGANLGGDGGTGFFPGGGGGGGANPSSEDIFGVGAVGLVVITWQAAVMFVDALLLKASIVDFTVSGCVIAAQSTHTFNIDALLAPENTHTFTVDGVLQRKDTLTFTVDAELAAGHTRTFTVDAELAAGHTRTFTVDALLANLHTHTFTVDADVLTGTSSYYKLSFNGANQYVNFGNPSVLQITGALSISLWINVNSSTTSGYVLTKGVDGVGGYGVYLANVSGTGAFQFRLSTGEIGTTVSLGTLYHFVCVYNPTGSMVYIYVNGSLVNSFSTAGTLINTSDNLYIGCNNGAASFWKGTVDAVRIYNIALTSTQAGILYGSGSGLSTLTATGLTSAPVGWWKFDEGSGTTATDGSGNGNNGTLMNSPAYQGATILG